MPLFEGIYSDLFPGIELPVFERADLIECIKERIEEKQLCGSPWYMEKIMQIYEMILVRHGLMIVGRPLGGKTQAYQVTFQHSNSIIFWKMISTDFGRITGKIG